jgi:hypothetical protein
MHGDTPAVLPTRFAPPPGHYAISLTSLDGIPLADNEMYDWFRWHKPTDRIANAIHYYRITNADVATYWVAQCTNPVTPLTVDVISEGFGTSMQRRTILFDCTQTWVYPSASQSSGAYILHGSFLENNLFTKLHYTQPDAADHFINSHLQQTQLIYQQRQYRDNPAFGIFRMQRPSGYGGPEMTQVLAAPAETPPLVIDEYSPINTPVYFDGPFTFLGINILQRDDILDIETWWQLTHEDPGIKPMSIMTHLLSETGENLGIADGMGINPNELKSGDVIAQRHQFVMGSDWSAGDFLIRIGLYWLENGERIRLQDNAAIDALYIWLEK